jgi:hypothetical protein
MSTGSVNDIWTSMNEDVPKHNISLSKLATAKVNSKKKAVKKEMSLPSSSSTSDISAPKKESAIPDLLQGPVLVSYNDLSSLLSKYSSRVNDSDLSTRKNAFIELHHLLFFEKKLSEEDYSLVFQDFSKIIFKRYADASEKCREMSQKLTKSFFSSSCDLVPVLGYYFPALMQRLPPGTAYDDGLKIFINDEETHEAYKRGKAVDRQDKTGILGDPVAVKIIESSEEIRFLACDALSCLLQRSIELNNCSILHPYFEDIIFFLQVQLRDPLPDLKVLACNALELLAKTKDFEIGMKYYSIALVRALLPLLRHRHAKVRYASLAAMHYVMIVPDRSKRKASGSEAIQDLVGFREDNVLPIAAFYKPDVSINYLAELVSDASQMVRSELVAFLSSLLLDIDDRFDHCTRLLPYLLDLMTDEVPTVSFAALTVLQGCGKQYEEEHYTEILEKKQYGMDATNDRINLEKGSYPTPFTERPGLGMRYYVRGNSKRFLLALVNELTNWRAPTRLKSANLLKLIIVLCEEQLTMEASSLLPLLIKALKFAREDNDQVLVTTLLEVFELLGRYLLPELYVFYLLPRLRGDNPELYSSGLDSEMKITVLLFLNALLCGSKGKEIIPYLNDIINSITDSFVIPFDSLICRSHSLDIIVTILSKFTDETTTATATSAKKKVGNILNSYYLSTGRLESLQQVTIQIMKYCLIEPASASSVVGLGSSNDHPPSLIEKDYQIMHCLASIHSPSSSVSASSSSLQALFSKFFPTLFQQALNHYSFENYEETLTIHHRILLKIIECPFFTIHSPSSSSLVTSSTTSNTADVSPSIRQFFTFLSLKIKEFQQHNTTNSLSPTDLEIENNYLFSLFELFLSFLFPLIVKEFPSHSSLKAWNSVFYKSTIFPGISVPEEGINNNHNNNGDGFILAIKASLEESGLLKELFSFLSNDLRWNRNRKLSFQRLFLFSGLFQYEFPSVISLPFQPSVDDDGMIWVNAYDGILIPFNLKSENKIVSSSFFSISSSPSSASVSASSSSLIPTYQLILQNILLSSLHAKNPISLRYYSLSFIRQLLSHLRESLGLFKVKSFQFWKSQYDWKNPSFSMKITSYDQFLNLKQSMQVTFQCLLTGLNDGDESIRSLILSILQDNVTLITADDEVKAVSSSNEAISFSSMMEKLLLALMVVSSSREATTKKEMEEMNEVLRMLCVLDPVTSERLIRKEFIQFNEVIEKTPFLSEIMNSLINHVDLLQSLENI